ncbi:MAG: DNA repair protein RecN [Clostridia bacterium]|nr:DNA repair protein RecN [Clostridia bacterium]
MLIELTIRNIALIESLRIEFAQGFNVLTGETGSGKSIVVDCMNLVLGARSDREIIRTGAEKGSVQALFDVENNERAKALAEELGVECEDGMLTVTREISRSGRNICRLSGLVVTLAQLKQMTALLLDIHGQHEHQSLMNPLKHIDFLDAFGGESHHALKQKVAELHQERTKNMSLLKHLMTDAAEKERLTDMLTFQVEEITAARLKRGEEEMITERLAVLENAEKIRERLSVAVRSVYSGGREPSAQETLSAAVTALEAISSYNKAYAELADRVRGAYVTVQDIGYALQAAFDKIEVGPDRLDRWSARLELIDKLERKYGPTIDDVLAFGEKASERLESIQSADARIGDLKKTVKQLDKTLREACEALTASRTELADVLSKRVMAQLADLGMGRTQFAVRIQPEPKPTANGLDQVEFMISPNPGEPLRPLAAIASGGELSRIMLALKAISVDAEGVDAMVFDEIDTGVSGRMAQVVGEKMCKIAVDHQVMCVTHLPQIAALGDAHYRVEKNVVGERTETNVIRLDEHGRVLELSRLVGGADDSESSLSHAAHMLSAAAEVRESMKAK